MKTHIAAFIDRLLAHVGLRLFMTGKGAADYRIRHHEAAAISSVRLITGRLS